MRPRRSHDKESGGGGGGGVALDDAVSPEMQASVADRPAVANGSDAVRYGASRQCSRFRVSTTSSPAVDSIHLITCNSVWRCFLCL